MKTAVLFDNFGPYHLARLGAAARVCDLLAVEVVERSAEYAWPPAAQALGFQRETLLKQTAGDKTDRQLLAVRLGNVLSSFRPDVVAIPGWSSGAALAAMRWCAEHRVPTIVMSESQAIDDARHPIKEWVKRCCLRGFGAALVGGRSHQEYLRQLGMAAEKVFLGYDAVDNDYFTCGAAAARSDESATREKFSLPERYFLASSRFIPKKNLPFLVRAYELYRRRCKQPSWDLVLLGDGAVRGEIESLIATLGLQGHVLLPGFRQYDELPAYYGLAGAFLHASTTEQWGLVVNEAMASGLAVLVSNRCGCALELVCNGVNGYEFDPGDEQALAMHLIEISGDEGRRESMGLASRAQVCKWGPERFARGMHDAAKCAVAAGPPRRGWIDSVVVRLLAAMT